MTLAQKMEQILKNELKPDSIKMVVKIAQFLKFKENQSKWNEINESEPEYITEEERAHLEEVKMKGDFIDQKELLKELGISEDEICN
ncbi:MAG: hypothetical protein PHS83_00510 [Clostridia bacterium]|nr:hypothetical protein [Clostridia bacterium]MDD4145586.1 hypothetical protein [Clostridia bacterium]MDD4665237.1 hypothetical protein [Clostridia bacterium]